MADLIKGGIIAGIYATAIQYEVWTGSRGSLLDMTGRACDTKKQKDNREEPNTYFSHITKILILKIS